MEHLDAVEEQINRLYSINNKEQLFTNIGELFQEVKNISNFPDRRRLASKLNDVSLSALDGDLKEMVRNHRLVDKSSEFVIRGIRTVNDLAKLLYRHECNEISDSDRVFIMNLRGRAYDLGSDLETLGALAYNEVDLSEPWVKKLCDSYRTHSAFKNITENSLKTILAPASLRDREIVYKLYNDASHKRRERISCCDNSQDSFAAKRDSLKATQERMKMEVKGNVDSSLDQINLQASFTEKKEILKERMKMEIRDNQRPVQHKQCHGQQTKSYIEIVEPLQEFAPPICVVSEHPPPLPPRTFHTKQDGYNGQNKKPVNFMPRMPPSRRPPPPPPPPPRTRTPLLDTSKAATENVPDTNPDSASGYLEPVIHRRQQNPHDEFAKPQSQCSTPRLPPTRLLPAPPLQDARPDLSIDRQSFSKFLLVEPHTYCEIDEPDELYSPPTLTPSKQKTDAPNLKPRPDSSPEPSTHRLAKDLPGTVLRSPYLTMPHEASHENHPRMLEEKLGTQSDKTKSDNRFKQSQEFTSRSFCVDCPPNLHPVNSCEFIIDSLRKRKETFTLKQKKRDKPVCWTQKAKKSQSDAFQSAFVTLWQLLDRCDLTGKMDLFQMLLEQRYTAPIALASTNTIKYYMEALRFVDVKLIKKVISVIVDIDLPRVVFLSERKVGLTENAHVVEEVFHCKASSSYCKAELGSSAELGVGFLEDSDTDRSDYNAWLVLYIRGDYKPLLSLIDMFASLIVVELDPTTDVRQQIVGITTRENFHLLRWQNCHGELESINEGDIMAITGSFHDVIEEMVDALTSLERKSTHNSFRFSIDEISDKCAYSDIDNLAFLEGINTGTMQLDFKKVRSSFILQYSFVKESKLLRKMRLIRRDESKRDECQALISREISTRKHDGNSQEKLPILQTFLKILNREDSIVRIMGLKQFERSIEQGSEETLKEEMKKVTLAWKSYDANRKDDLALEQYYAAKTEYTNKVVGLEHLWRELSHIYVTNPRIYSKFPECAAQHILDGFSLEIMDGDAGAVNIKWCESVMSALNARITNQLGRKPKVFVISAMGTQSTGKSTLLNTMFGCRLRTSAGQCTRGVHLQLVKANNRGLDFVLVMDTEGIRAPEFYGTSNSVWSDNRMATFAVLPADACLITVINEDDTAIKEVLPIVMLAFKGSAIAEDTFGRMRSLVMFVYSRVETSPQALHKFQQNQRQLLVALEEAAQKIVGQKIAGDGKSIDRNIGKGNDILQEFLARFRTNEDESMSDVKYLGTLNKEEKPPFDKPNFEYGEKVEQIREYIQHRLVENDFKGHAFTEWVDYLKLVLQCIETTDFELNFRTAMQYRSYNELSAKIGQCRCNISVAYSTIFEEYNTTMLNADEMPNYTELWDGLESKVQNTVSQENAVVLSTLKSSAFKEFESAEMSQWKSFISQQKLYWESVLKTAFENQWAFAEEEAKYEQSILKTLKVAFDTNSKKYKNEREQKVLFDEIFKNQQAEAREKNPPINITEKILDEYERGVHKVSLINFKKSLRTVKSYQTLSNDMFSKRPKLDTIAKKLCAQVKDLVRGVKRYEPSIIQKSIELTKNTMFETSELSRYETGVHNMIFVLLSNEFTKIHRQWESTNNIAARLQASKDRMWAKFKSICKGFVGAHAVASDLNEGLKQAVRDGFKNYYALQVKTNLHSALWVGRPDVMQAYIDLDLISLIESGNTNRLLNVLQDSSEHYKSVLYSLIGQNVDPSGSWKSIICTIQQALCETIVLIQTSGTIRPCKFRSEFVKKLPNAIKEKLSPMTWRYITEHKEKFDFKLWKEIESLLLEHIGAWDADIAEDIVKDVHTQKLGELVAELLEREGQTSSRQRCSEACPLCKMTCIKQVGHETELTDIASKHDCPHQPGGIVGGFWWEDCRHAHELVAESCSQHVANGDTFRFEGTFVPFRDFEKYFPNWALPNITQRQELREYIFYNYQNEILAKYPFTLICSYMPAIFNHDLQELKQILTEKIRTDSY